MPDLIRHTASQLLEEIRLLEARIAQVERQLSLAARHSPACTLLLSIPGIDCSPPQPWWQPPGQRDALPGRTSLLQLVWPDAPRVQLGRQPLPGRISKKGDRYLRMLLTHGARRCCERPTVAQGGQGGTGRAPLGAGCRGSNHNKATCALANKLARICYATLRDHAPFDEAARLSKRPTAKALPCQPETHATASFLSPLATGLIDHHGQSGSSAPSALQLLPPQTLVLVNLTLQSSWFLHRSSPSSAFPLGVLPRRASVVQALRRFVAFPPPAHTGKRRQLWGW